MMNDTAHYVRLALIVMGLVFLGVQFQGAHDAIQRDYKLRVTKKWDGQSGTDAGVRAHLDNALAGRTASRNIVLGTFTMGALLLIPRRRESVFFRWGGWTFGLIAVVLCLALFTTLLGVSLYGAMLSSNSFCIGITSDDCPDIAARALTPRSWREVYLGQLMAAAVFVPTVGCMALAIRWMIWLLVASLRRLTQPAVIVEVGPVISQSGR